MDRSIGIPIVMSAGGAAAAAAHGAGGHSGSKSKASPATAYCTARDSQPESFEEWRAMLMASSSAKAEPSAPILGATD